MSRMSRFLNFVLPARKDRNFTAGFGKSLLLGSLVWCGSAQAETLVSSLPQTEVSPAQLFPGQWIASPFQTSTQTWSVSSITLPLWPAGVEPTTAALRLYSDNGSKPGSVVADFGTLSVDFSDPLLRTFALPTPVTLNASTTYWVALGDVAAGDTALLGSDIVDSSTYSFSFTGVPGASMTYSASLLDANTSSWSASESGLALLFQVDSPPAANPIARPTIQPLTLSGTNWLVQFQSQTGATYILQTAAGLNGTPVWTDVATNSGTGNLLSIPVPVAPANAQQFFRLRVPVP